MDTFVAITTSRSPEGTGSIELSQELEKIIPHSKYIPWNEDFPAHSALVKVVENSKAPFCVRVSDSEGEIEFKIISYKSKKYLGNRAVITQENPQLVVHNFVSPLGHQVVEWLARLFPSRVEGRQVASFHCKNDFIFFRLHRYIFREDHIDFQDIGPHLILKLKKLSDKASVIYECKKYDKRIVVL